MDALYYISGVLITLGIPALGIGIIAALIKPHLINDRRVIKKPMSRSKIAAVGLTTLLVSFVSLSSVIAATEPASIKQERAARETAELKALQQKQEQQQQEAEAQKKADEEARKRAEEANKPVVKTETETEIIKFKSIERKDSTIPAGQKRLSIAGVDGERTITYEVTYQNGEEVGRTEIKNEITKQPVTQITLNGTYVKPTPVKTPSRSNCDPNYSGCVPNVSYDLDCADIGYSVRVLGYDKHRLDRDNDGYGCESY